MVMTKLLLPKLGMTMTHGKVIKWLAAEGDRIEKRKEILEVDTDKVTLKIESPVDGFLRKIVVEEKKKVPVGKILAIITTDLEEEIGDLEEILKEEQIEEKIITPIVMPTITQSNLPIERGRIFISPRAKKLAAEKDVNIKYVIGTGPGGRIVEKDIITFLERPTNLTNSGILIRESIPLDGIRGIISDRMKYSINEIPQLTLTMKINFDNISILRKEINKKYFKNISFTDIIVKIVSIVLQEFPIINSTIEFGEIKVLEEINIGVAAATDRGLIVPVVKNADKKSLFEISKEIKRLARDARVGTLMLDDLSKGTFTVTNLGMFGIEAFTPIINPPESAILGVGKIINEVVQNKKSQFESKPMMTLSLTMDHRPFDGHVGAQFLSRIKEIIESEENLRNLLNFVETKIIEIPDNEEYQYDICVIGGGPGGYSAALNAMELGKKVVLIEKNLIGGTCVNRGCIPSQIFIQVAQNLKLLEKIKKRNMGIDLDNFKISCKKITKRIDSIVTMLREGIERNIKNSEIDLIMGEAHLKSLHDVEIRTIDGKSKILNSKYIIFATGLMENKDLEKFGETDFLNAFSQCNSIPQNVIIIGSNYIAFEVASILHAFGSEVTILEQKNKYDICIDEEIQSILLESFDLMDISVLNDIIITEIVEDKLKKVLKYKKGEKIKEIKYDLILDLRNELKCIPKLVSNKFIDKFGELIIGKDHSTNFNNIFVIGDLKNEMKLSGLATLDGMVVIQKIFNKNQINYPTFIPISLRTVPEVGCIGLTERQALDEGYNVKVTRYPFAMNPMLRIVEEPEGMVKIIADKRSGKLLGVHLIGQCSSELIHEFLYIFKSELSPIDLVSTAPFHPSFSEMFRDAFKNLYLSND
ncbi:MAG: FAD-dependent oxidoreductase [Candidatus Lokiarchaeota archaeon]|nr:FAD-dependent oxidoreductase [Candidatus Lokiarchaeota archaeon]